MKVQPMTGNPQPGYISSQYENRRRFHCDKASQRGNTMLRLYNIERRYSHSHAVCLPHRHSHIEPSELIIIINCVVPCDERRVLRSGDLNRLTHVSRLNINGRFILFAYNNISSVSLLW